MPADITAVIPNLANALNKAVNATRTLDNDPSDVQETAAAVALISAAQNYGVSTELRGQAWLIA